MSASSPPSPAFLPRRARPRACAWPSRLEFSCGAQSLCDMSRVVSAGAQEEHLFVSGSLEGPKALGRCLPARVPRPHVSERSGAELASQKERKYPAETPNHGREGGVWKGTLPGPALSTSRRRLLIKIHPGGQRGTSRWGHSVCDTSSVRAGPQEVGAPCAHGHTLLTAVCMV